MFVHRGEVAGDCYYGLADRAAGRAVDERTIYHWASITKTLTGIALLQLRDRGLLSLEDPIVRYVPELKVVHNPFGSMEDVTLRHLLSHSSGFRTSTWPWGGKSWQPHEPTAWSQIVAMLPYTEIRFEPGSRYSYSNPGIIFLGRVIELLTGDDYEVYVQKNILTPLGMRDSYFDGTPYHLLRHRSDNYTVRGEEIIANGLDFDTGITTSNGGLNGPLTDMVKYLAFLTGDMGEPGRSVLRRSSLEEMWKPLQSAGALDGIETSMGLTFFVLRAGERRYLGHTGGQKSFVSFIYFHPESRAAAVAAFNTLGAADGKPHTRAILARVRAALFERIFPLFGDS